MRSIGAIYLARPVVASFAAMPLFWLVFLDFRPGEAAHEGVSVVCSALESTAEPLTDLNKEFRDAYGRCRQRLVNRSGAIIVVEGDNLVLLYNGKRSEAKVVPDIYHTLKAVSHVPLAVYVMLVGFEDRPLDKECLDGLRAYRERVARAEESLKSRDLAEDVLLRQQDIIHAALRFLDAALDKKQVTSVELCKFTRDQGCKLLANAGDAARVQLEMLAKQARAWHAILPVAEWKKLHVVVMGSALPRQGNLATQYFAHLLGEKGEGTRIVYAESLFEEARAVNLLGTHLLDTGIGSAFFDDAERMHRDLLSDAAREYLKKMTVEP